MIERTAPPSPPALPDRAAPLRLAGALLVALLCPASGLAQTVLVGPTPYLSQADTPAGFFDAGGATAFEDFEDCSLDFGFLASAGQAISLPGGPCAATSINVDSVDADDGVIDGNGSNGRSWFSSSGTPGITFTFPSPVTAAGVVWTDGEGTTSFEAFGPGMVSLGTIGPVSIEDGQTGGSTADDHFFGVKDPGGIVALRVSNTAGGIELDHLQTGAAGAAPVPTGIVTTIGLAIGLVGLGATAARRRRRA